MPPFHYVKVECPRCGRTIGGVPLEDGGVRLVKHLRGLTGAHLQCPAGERVIVRDQDGWRLEPAEPED